MNNKSHTTIRVGTVGGFFSYVFVLVGAGILSTGIVSTVCGTLFLKLAMYTGINLNSILLITVIMAAISSYVVDYLMNKNLLAYSTAKNFILYLVSTALTGIMLAPVYILGSYIGFAEITMAFVLAASFFVGLSLYAIISGKDFTPLRGILFVGVILLCILGLIKWVLYFVNPALAVHFSLVHSVIGLVLSIGFLLYNISNLQNLYYNSPNTRTVLRVGIYGALILFHNFVSLFLYILNILLYRKRRDN